jgi:hypothetical protein
VPDRRSRVEAGALTAAGVPLVRVAKVGVDVLPSLRGVAGLDDRVVVVAVVPLPVAP